MLEFDEDIAYTGGDKPIVGIFTQGLSGRKFGKPLEHFPDFYCAKESNGFTFIWHRIYSIDGNYRVITLFLLW